MHPTSSVSKDDKPCWRAMTKRLLPASGAYCREQFSCVFTRVVLKSSASSTCYTTVFLYSDTYDVVIHPCY